MLAFIGMGMAFLFVGLMVSGTGTSHEDVWMYQSSPKKLLEIPMLSEKQRQMAIEIAKQNETVKQYLEQGYEIARVCPIGNLSKEEEAIDAVSVDVFLVKDKEWVYANIDLDKREVTRILKLDGEVAGFEMQKGKIKAVNETEIRIAIGGKVGKLIRAPKVRELTEEEREKARDVALSDPEVKNIMNRKNYEMEIKSTGMIIINEAGEVETKFDGASLTFELEDGTVYFVHVDLEKGKVIRISPPIPPPETSGKKVGE
jgi:hypothetical protein